MYDDNTQPRFPAPGKTAKDDTLAVMKFYHLPKDFPPAVLAEAAKLTAEPVAQALKGRMDLRKRFIFTCDPETARDYDDALSFATDRKGNRVLGVHIADVSHYVRPGSAIDREAYKRSTSVYFCDRVIPMLPEALSNGLCSLVPGEDRLAFSVFMTFDRNGEMIKREFAKSVIRSQARYTYEQVMAEIRPPAKAQPKTRSGRGLAIDKTAKIGKRERKVLLSLNQLAQQLRQRRFAAGALDLEVPEVEVRLNARGELDHLETRPYDESHQLIEECMVAANEAVAKELWTRGVKILARLHESPDPEKLLTLRAEMRGLGVKLGNIASPKVFAQFLKSIKSNPLYPTLATMVLRSMKRAVYDSRAIGHFGLAKKYYAHFTSPIRRYPDLTLHRQLAAYLTGRGPNGEAPLKAKVPPKLLETWAEHTSERENIAAEAERGLLEIKKYRLLEREIASRNLREYAAVIAKCTPYGCFVEIPELAVSGLVHISQLSHKFVTFNESDQTLSAYGGAHWRIGDQLKVVVARVDMRERKLDFLPIVSRASRFDGRPQKGKYKEDESTNRRIEKSKNFKRARGHHSWN